MRTMKTNYTTLTELQELATIRKDSYGYRFAIKTSYLGIFLDLIIPFTFGLITYSLSKTVRPVLVYLPIHNKEKHRFVC